jgi:hypothetical protein
MAFAAVLGIFSNSGRSSAPALKSSQAGGHLTPTSNYSNCRRKTISYSSQIQ